MPWYVIVAAIHPARKACTASRRGRGGGAAPCFCRCSGSLGDHGNLASCCQVAGTDHVAVPVRLIPTLGLGWWRRHSPRLGCGFPLSAPGTYSLPCGKSHPKVNYAVGEVRRAGDSLISRPLMVIWLLGAASGLPIIAEAARRRPARCSGLRRAHPGRAVAPRFVYHRSTLPAALLLMRQRHQIWARGRQTGCHRLCA